MAISARPSAVSGLTSRAWVAETQFRAILSAMSNVIAMPDRSTVRSRVASEVGAEIGRARTSQAAVARAAGIAQSTFNRKMKARAERDAFDVEELDRIARVLNVPISKFLAAADDGPDGGDGGSRLGESNPRPSHYRASVARTTGELSRGRVIPLRRRQAAPVAPLHKIPA